MVHLVGDIGNTETDVPESELRLSETSAKENDEIYNHQMPRGKVVIAGSKCNDDEDINVEGNLNRQCESGGAMEAMNHEIRGPRNQVNHMK